MGSVTGTVTGVKEVQDALQSVADFDQIKAGNAAAEAVIPYVRAGTRTLTGNMSVAWQAKDGAFVNEVSYAMYQEYGTIYVEATHAIAKAWDAHAKDVIDAYSEVIDSAISEAGFRP